VHILTNLLFLWCPLTENNPIKGVHQDRCFFAWRQKHGPKCCAALKN